MKPDAIISFRFLTTAEGGRDTAVEGNFYACPLFIDDEGFDCRIFLEGRRFDLGFTYEAPVKFLYCERAIPKLAIGKKILLWEGRYVAEGRVINILAD